jgi:hypothetical protein
MHDGVLLQTVNGNGLELDISDEYRIAQFQS